MSDYRHTIEQAGDSHAALRSELLSMKESGDPHFEFIDVEHLDGKEYALFEKFVSKTLTDADIASYRDELRSAHRTGDTPLHDSRENFLAFILNRHLGRRAAERYPSEPGGLAGGPNR